MTSFGRMSASIRNRISLSVVAVAVFAAPAMARSGAEVSDARWTPWLGCWRLMTDEIRDPILSDPDLAEAEDGELTSGRRGPVFVCLGPAEGADDAVQVSTVEDDLVFLEETLVADGERRDVRRDDCKGWQRSVWSEDGNRLFMRSELTCGIGAGAKRRSISGVSVLVDRSTWVEIQAVGNGDGRAVLLRRYRSADPESLEVSPEALGLSSRIAEAAALERGRRTFSLSVDDVIEASGALDPEAVEALVLEREEGFAISSESLLRLDRAEVHPGIIDLMVALTFPERFVVDSGGMDSSAGHGWGGAGLPFYSPFYSSMAYPYYAAPFGYYYWFAPHDPFFVVGPVETGGVSQSRVVNERGYTQVKPRSSEPSPRFATPRGGSGGDGVSSRGGSSTSSGGSGVSGSSGSSGGASASPSGYSRGGSSGRSAKPKKK